MKDIEQKKFNRFIKLGIENHIDIKIQANLSHEVLLSKSMIPVANAGDIVELRMSPAIITSIQG